jgi:hypothetical protein
MLQDFARGHGRGEQGFRPEQGKNKERRTKEKKKKEKDKKKRMKKK